MTTKHLKLGVCVFVLLIGKAALGQDGGWGPVSTQKQSLVNMEPWALPFFNNGPSFGVPGTVTGSPWARTQLTDDWGGARTNLAERGWFFDAYTTSVYQNVRAGGLKTGSALVQNVQLSVNLDTGRAGLWRGGLVHFTAQSRYGDSPANTFTAGSVLPQYTGLVLPGPLFSNNSYPSEYFLVQGLSENFSIVLGKISNIFIPDQTLFGDSYKYDFANFNFLKTPMTPNFFNPTSMAAIGAWRPSKSVAIRGGVLDPNSQPDNFADHAFDRVNLYITSILSYKITGRPGQVSPAFNWSNKPKINLELPFTAVPPPRRTQAVAALLGVSSTEGLQTNFKDDSWFAIANVSQYLSVKDDSAAVDEKLKSGQLLRGIGVFARAGYAPEISNTIARNASVALFAHGIFDNRKYDDVGAGFYYDGISRDLKSTVALLTAGTAAAGNEKGTEVFYDFAVTPAARLIASYQHIWNPLTAEVAARQTSADVFLLRLTLAF